MRPEQEQALATVAGDDRQTTLRIDRDRRLDRQSAFTSRGRERKTKVDGNPPENDDRRQDSRKCYRCVHDRRQTQ